MEKSGGRKEWGAKPQEPPHIEEISIQSFSLSCSHRLLIPLSLSSHSAWILSLFLLPLLSPPHRHPPLPPSLVQIMESSRIWRSAGMDTERVYACGCAQKETLEPPTTDLHWQAHLTIPKEMRRATAHGLADASGQILQTRTHVFFSKRKNVTVDPGRILHSMAV